MGDTVFSEFQTVHFEGRDSENSLAYRFYDADQLVNAVRRAHAEPPVDATARPDGAGEGQGGCRVRMISGWEVRCST
jgi:hypothetical protein